jgi:ubiquinone/menaquinone biosynthesis C-methylase UbiE
MCGNGRMLIPFMQKGIDIEGFDISEEMLKVCKEKGERLNLHPIVFQEKIEEFKSDKKYDLIIIPFGSFSLLPDSLVNASLLNLISVLNKNGKLLLTIMKKNDRVDEIPNWIETNRKLINKEVIVEYKKVLFDEENNTLNTKLKYQSILDNRINKTEVMDFPLRLYDLEEFEGLLKTNGINNITVHEVENGYGTGSSFQVFECYMSQ